MEKRDFSDYEKRRGQLHEELCRLTSTLGFIANGFCRRRACRRIRICSGPMLPSPHQAGVIRAQRDIGLSGEACAGLPACIAHGDPDYYALYRTAMDDVRRMREEQPEVDHLPIFIRIAARRRPLPDIS